MCCKMKEKAEGIGVVVGVMKEMIEDQNRIERRVKKRWKVFEGLRIEKEFAKGGAWRCSHPLF